MAAEYEHLIYDISHAALRVISQSVRAVIGGTTDMRVQTELHNFANECDNRIQHHEREVRQETIAAINAAHKAPVPIVHINVADGDRFDDLL